VAVPDTVYSFKDDGGHGYFLLDTGHGNVALTTGTGSQWTLVPDGSLGGIFLIESGSGHCLDVADDPVYNESCVHGDHNEDFYLHSGSQSGGFVIRNYATGLNLTATGIYNGAIVYVTSGAASADNTWLLTAL